MLRRMLLALDRTPSGAVAVDWALHWAGRTGALLLGLAVVPEPVIRRPEPLPIGGSHFKAWRDTTLVAHAHTAVHELLGDFEARCTAAGVPYQAMARTGVPWTEITREAHGVDLVVVGRDAEFSSLRTRANNDLRWLLRQAPRPVIAVPEDASYGSGVLVVYDGSVCAAHALYAFTHSGLVGQDGVRLLVTQEPPARAASETEQALEFLQAHDIPTEIVPADTEAATPAAYVLRHVTAASEMRLIVLGLADASPLRGLLGGLTARAILQHAPVPVFLFRS